jgi:hypothetical protein
MLIIAPATLSQERIAAIVAALSLGDMLHVVVLHCDKVDLHHAVGLCKCQSSAGDFGCRANVTDLVKEIRSSNLIVTFNHADARHMMWGGLEVAIVVLDGPDMLVTPTSTTSSLSSSKLRLLQLHRYARDQEYTLLVQSATPSFSDLQMIESAVRVARNFGRGVAFCGVKCGSPMKPQLWTPISYEWDNQKWIKEVHDPFEKSLGWG